MLHSDSTSRRLIAALSLMCLLPATASAQDNGLRIPTMAASAAAAADWVSTYHALKYYNVRETNPLLRPLDGSPFSLVAAGGLIDAGTFSVWNLTVGRRHERLAAAGLWAMAAFRTYLTIHNIRNQRRAERR
ncbi:MAG: hypothetical protein ACRD3C_24250 [Vicinamibacterales bacterium]